MAGVRIMPRKRNVRKWTIRQASETPDNGWDSEHPRNALAWDDGGASYKRALERYRVQTGEEPVTRYHSFTHAFQLVVARCKLCGCGVATLAISRATPWRTTDEAASYAFWRRFTAFGSSENCPHAGTLPDPALIRDTISRALRVEAAERPVKSVRNPRTFDPSVYFDGAASKFYVAVDPAHP
jgi:hypothetical protein